VPALTRLGAYGDDAGVVTPDVFMKSIVPLLCCAALSLPAPTAADETLDTVVVTGTRRSLESALARKRAAPGIVDSVVADEIHKLPDLSVVDALQRITGVQITRDRGEGGIAAVRGLIQVETTLNGREIFTAGTGRTMDFSDIAAESLAGIDVHKTASAERIEGGLGGTVDLRTRRPFDFAGDTGLFSARWMRGHLAQRDAGQASLLVSRRGAVGSGELGLLVNLALQDRYWREDQKGTGVPARRTDLIAERDVFAPGSSSETTSVGRRRRGAASALLQWRPSPALELYAEGHFAELETRQDSHQINLSAGTGFVPGSLQLFPGSDDVQRITWTDAPVSVLSFARDTVDRTRQLAAGGRWSDERWQVEADLSVTKSFNHLFFSGPFFAGRAALCTNDPSGWGPPTAGAATDLADPANLRYTGLAYRTRPFQGELLAARLDVQRQLGGEFVERLEFGWRHARRRADNTPGLIFADAALNGPPAADTPGRVQVSPYLDFLDGRAGSVTGTLIGNLGDARDAQALRDAFGITTPIPAAAGPLSLWRIREDTDAFYLQAPWRWPALALDGQAGARAVHTRRSTDSAQQVAGGTPEPIRGVASDTDWLPSASLRWQPAPQWQARAALSRTVTRPDFNQLSPSLVLTPNPIDPNLNQGSAGNPALRAVRSNNLDLALERAFGPGAGASLALFWKQVDGFVVNIGQLEEHGGQPYSVSRPRNADPARVRGAELAWQQFFDGLPGAWRGLGLQANYTYVDSETFDRVLRRHVPLQNFSRHSANLIGLYESGPWSARLAWNWRSRFLSGVTPTVSLGPLEAWTQSYGWLDASLRWRMSPRVTWAIDGQNLTRTLRRSDFGAASRPQNAFVNDRQVAASVSVQF
jgi:iron complex outermembrane receptor protein